jgi:hypothetical protein
MKVIKRTMLADEKIRTSENNVDEYFPYCQASFNSDGNITLRNYDKGNKDKDEIIILSESETKAVFELLHQIKKKAENYELPF